MSVKNKLDAVADVKIDDGTFKYIQIRVGDQQSSVEKIVIRGDGGAEYHADIYDQETSGIEALGFYTEPIGGGRIRHDSLTKTLHVYGYSMGFGRADHTITVEKLKNSHPGYTITWSNEGY